MAITLAQQGNNIQYGLSSYRVDTNAEMQTLTSAAMHSICLVIKDETDEDKLNAYIKTAEGWVKI